MLVCWDQPTKRPRPRSGARQETFYPVLCTCCGRSRYLRSADARRAERENTPCATCQRRAAGKAGYRATVERYGEEFFLECAARVQREKPSSAEQKLAGMLDELGAVYERQRKLRGPARSFLLDFVLSNGCVIEVNGYWHQRTGAARDQELTRTWERRVVFIKADELDTRPDEVRELLYELIQQ
jgi:hypothetical protein